jgi:iron complex transport system ATP-binding protein
MGTYEKETNCIVMELKLEHINVNLPIRGGGNRKLLSGVNLSVQGGDFTLLYGDNGSGKTSLIRAVAGLNPYYSGSIQIREKAVDVESHIGLIKSHSSILLTVPVRPVGMRVREFLDLYENERDIALYKELFELFSIGKLMDSFMDSVSDGERQKVLLTKVLSKKTNLLILDEPSTYLDFNSREKLYDFLSSRLIKLNKAILISTHDLHNAKKHLNNSYYVKDGAVEETGLELTISKT